MSSAAVGWQDEHLLDHRRRLRNGLLVSLAVHGVFFAMLAISPSRTAPPLPEVLSVDLIAAPVAPRAAPKPAVARPRAAPAPAKPVAPKAAPKPVPKAAPEPPPPPIAKAPVQALPENAPSKVRKAQPKARVDPRLRPKEKELSLEDAMAALDDELGPSEHPDLLQPVPEEPPPVEPDDSAGSPGRRGGIQVSPEMLAWANATTRRIQNSWKGVSSYEGRGLATTLALELSASGDVLGTPEVVRSSGDPYFDDNAVRAVMMVSPLPRPPRAGPTTFVFRSEAD